MTPASDSLWPPAEREPDRIHRPIESRWFEVFGLGVHARVGGEGVPVVLVHGYGVSGTYMLPLAQSLAPFFSVFVPDLPGYGRSQSPGAPLGIADLAAALAGCLDASGLQRPAFVANSMGCQIVTELAVHLPGRVGPLVLVGPTVDPQRRAARHQLLGGLRDAAREPRSLLGIAARDDAVVGETWAERATALLPRGRLIVVPSEPHAVHYTRPDLVARLVHELLVEESQQARRQLPRRLPHRHVPAVEAHKPGAGQDSLPLRGDPGRKKPVVIAPDEQGPGVDRGVLGGQFPVGYEQSPAVFSERYGAHRVAHDCR